MGRGADGAVLEHDAVGFMFIEPDGAPQNLATLGRWATEIVPAVREAVGNA